MMLEFDFIGLGQSIVRVALPPALSVGLHHGDLVKKCFDGDLFGLQAIVCWLEQQRSTFPFTAQVDVSIKALFLEKLTKHLFQAISVHIDFSSRIAGDGVGKVCTLRSGPLILLLASCAGRAALDFLGNFTLPSSVGFK